MSVEKEYFIVSVKWTERREPYITLWGQDNSGYRGRIENSGRYKHADVMKHLGYYNNGHHTLAVPCELIEPLAVDIKPGWFDGEGGKWVPNNKANWDLILENSIAKPKYPPKPRYRGAPKSHVFEG